MPRRRKPNAGLGNKKAKKAKREAVVAAPQPIKCVDTVVTEEFVSNPDEKTVTENQDKTSRQMLYEKLNAIAYIFVHKYDGLGSGALQKGWEGKHGIINNIRKDLGLTRNTRTRVTTFQDIFLTLIECARSGSEFSIAKLLEANKTHRTPMISSSSP